MIHLPITEDNSRGVAITTDSSNNFYVVFDKNASAFASPWTIPTGVHRFVRKYNAEGILLWEDFNRTVWARDIAVGSDGSVYVTGRHVNDDASGSLLIRKYTPCGVSDDGPPDVQNVPACAGP